MELPHIGKHCSKKDCNKLDFLPIKCDACSSLFCDEHFRYTTHNCKNLYKKNNQVPVCPLCNIPIPVQKGLNPDYVVGNHIDSDCQSDPAKSRRRVFTNKCSFKKCKTREVIPVICKECALNYCLKHRHPTDHQCEGHNMKRRWIFDAQNNAEQQIREDEALAQALALSLQEQGNNKGTNNINKTKKTQEELDFALAKQLAASEENHSRNNSSSSSSSIYDRCNLS